MSDGSGTAPQPDHTAIVVWDGDDYGHHPDGDSSASPTTPVVVNGVLRVGRMTAARDTFLVFENPDLRCLLFQGDLPADTVIEADSGAEITILDADVHHWPVRPTIPQLRAYAAAVMPRPDVTWISHGRGMKFIYIGPHHCSRALAAAFRLPTSFHLEFLQYTRHPASASTKHPGACCGPVQFYENDVLAPYEFRSVGQWTPEARQEALDMLGMEDGRRYDHDRCPIAGDADSDAKSCVVVLEAGVFCHRCAGHGVRHQPHLAPGFYPFSAKVGSAATDLEVLGRERAHWTHARLELTHYHPNLAESLLQIAYRKVLEAMWGTDDPRIPLVFNRDLDLVWGEGVWLDAARLEATKFDDDVASAFPYNLDLIAVGVTFEVKVDRVRRSQAKNRTPRGYTPIRPIRGISFIQDPSAIPVLVPPHPKFPIAILTDPIPEEQAFAALGDPFPRLHRIYLKAVLAAAICAEAGEGQPPMLTCSGPSGSGKEVHIRLAASFMGQHVAKLVLSDSEEAFMRQIGVAISSGNRFVIFDEMGKTRDLSGKMKMLLAISSTVQWRPLYQNRLVNTPVRAAFVYPCVRFPDFIKGSEEFTRRTRHVHLYRRLPNWAATSGGDVAQWRDHNTDNARIANSILTHVWRDCNACGYRFF